MPYGYKCADLQAMVQAKLDDAVLLYNNGRFSNAYYLGVYAVEIGLKACISKQISAETIPDKTFINRILTHQFRDLIGLAGLSTALKEQQDKDPTFAAMWAIAAEWAPDDRYATKDGKTTQIMLNALTHTTSGVFQWIKAYW